MFCALEANNSIQKYVPQLIIQRDSVESTISDQKDVETEIHSFYKDLFECKDKYSEAESIETFLGPESAKSIPKLSSNERESMEGALTSEEITRYLKKTKNNVAPGASGFTNEFFKFFWRDMKTFVIKGSLQKKNSQFWDIVQKIETPPPAPPNLDVLSLDILR